MENNTTNRSRNASSYFIQDIIFHFIEWSKRLWIIVLILAMLGAAGLSFWTYYRFVPSYSASATFTVNVDVGSSADSYNKATANQLAATFPNILTSSSLSKVVCNDLGVDYLSANISASVVEDTNLFTITVTDNDPQKAYDVLQSVITNYPKVAKFVIGSTQLSLLDTSAISTMPNNVPNYTKKAIMGTAAGFMLGLMLLFLLSITTSTVIRGDDIKNAFNVNCLGTVVETAYKKRSKEKDAEVPDVQNPNINYQFREGIYSIRNSIIRNFTEKGYKSLLVTSTISGEGKSVIALNLAKSIALKGYKCCLVDFDLRVPSISGYINIDTDVNSISDYIKSDTPFKNTVYSTGIDNFYVAVERNNNSDASELVDSERAKEFIQKLCDVFEFVIIDTPPSGYISDAAVIGDFTDAAIYVVAQDVSSRRSIKKGLASFDGVKSNVLGCVLNRVTKGMDSANYGKYSLRRRYGKYGHYSRYGKYGNYHTASVSDEVIDTNFNGIEFEE